MLSQNNITDNKIVLFNIIITRGSNKFETLGFPEGTIFSYLCKIMHDTSVFSSIPVIFDSVKVEKRQCNDAFGQKTTIAMGVQ